MDFKRSLENSGTSSAKRLRLNSKEFQKSNENMPKPTTEETEHKETIVEFKFAVGNEQDKRADHMNYACRSGKLEIVTDLLKNGFDVNSGDIANNTALHHAASTGKVEIVKKLLENGASPYLANKFHFTPLHVASLNGHRQVVKEFLNQNIYINFEMNVGEDALELAARKGHLEIVKELLNAGVAAYKKVDEDHMFSRFPALSNLPSKLSDDHIEIVVEILKRHPYPLHEAVYQIGLPEVNIIIRKLIQSGISPNLQDKEGDTALHAAIIDDGNFQAFVEFLKHAVNIEIRNNDINTPLQIAVRDNKNEFAEELLKHGANPNCHEISEFGVKDTLLHIACRNENVLLVKILLKYGTNVNGLDHNNKSPLHSALMLDGSESRNEIIKELLENGANVDIKTTDNETALHYAADQDEIPEDLFQYILKQCQDLNAKSSEDELTALHLASEAGYESFVKTLLNHGADINIRNCDGYNPLENALNHEQEGVFKVMIYNN